MMKYLVVYHFKKTDQIVNHYYKDEEEMNNAIAKIDKKLCEVLHRFKIEELSN